MKKSKKLVSLLLAVLMAMTSLTVAVPALAANTNPDVTYTATYTDPASKEVYTGMMQDVDKLLADAAYTSSTMGTVWTLQFSLSSLLSNTALDDPATYVAADSALFDGLAAFMEENNYAAVTADVITAYFAAHPELITSGEDFAAHTKTFVNWLLTVQNANIQTTLNLVFVLGSLFGLGSLGDQIDSVVSALGFDPGDGIKKAVGNKELQVYLEPIVNGLLPNTAEGLMNVLRSIAVPENNAKLYENLNGIIDSLIPALDRLGSLVDLSAIKEPLTQVQTVLHSLPTEKVIIDGEAKDTFDINGILEYVINDVVVPMVAEQLGADVVSTVEGVLTDLGLSDLKLVSFTGGKAVLKFDAVNTANLAAAESPEDALNVILHYLYTNLNKTQNKLVLSAVNGIASLANVLPAEVSTILDAVLNQSEPQAVATIAGMLAKMANRNPVTAVEIAEATLFAGKDGNMYSGSVQLNAVLTPADASNQDLTWTSDKENVTVDANGLVTYKGTLDAPFDATITATAVGGATGSAKVHIEKASVTGISVSPAYTEAREGATVQLTAKIAPANAVNKDVTWTSSDDAVATVDANGLVTIVSTGSVKITAVPVANDKLSAVAVINVTADKDALNALLAKIDSMGLEETNDEFDAALAAAQDVADEVYATQEAVNVATANLQTALQALTGKEALEDGDVKIFPTSGEALEGDTVYHTTPWYKTWMSQMVDLGLTIDSEAEIVDVQWVAANWSVDDPEAKIENADDDSATIRPTFGVGPRSFWVKAVVTDAYGNTVESNAIKVRFINWDWQK